MKPFDIAKCIIETIYTECMCITDVISKAIEEIIPEWRYILKTQIIPNDN